LQDLRDHLLIDQDLGLEFLDPTVAMPAPQGAALSVSAPTGPTTTPDTAALPTPDVKRLEPDAAALPTPDARRQTPDVSLPLPAAELAAVAAQVAACRACGLCQTRTTTVPGEGNPGAELVFVGEGPGADEDAQGRPFVGKAGELLTAMIQAMGFSREEVYIANVVKCRPPGNRTPEPGEVAACLPYLDRQLLAIRPKIIVALGNTPLRALTGDDKLGITAHRGKMLAWRGIPLLPTFHPAYLLRNPPAKKPCWEDLKAVVQFLGRELPKRG
jgi:DNA polymerase